MKLGYYPGCALEGSARDYAMSLERVLQEIDVSPEPINDWNCCGASAAHSTNHKLSLALPYRNLALAEAQGLPDIFAPCPFCSKTLITTNYQLKEKEDLQSELESITNLSYKGSVNIINSVDIFHRLMDKIQPRLKPQLLKGLKVACYYGCVLVRPPKILNYDNSEQPVLMDEIVNKIGAEPVDWEFKIECCGGGFTISNPDAVIELSHKILEDAQENGAEAIIVACQMCQINLDMKQRQIEKKLKTSFNLPIIYLPQLVGLAMGIPPEELGLNLHFVNTKSVVDHVTRKESSVTHNVE